MYADNITRSGAELRGSVTKADPNTGLQVPDRIIGTLSSLFPGVNGHQGTYWTHRRGSEPLLKGYLQQV